jgi:hypothetical protein
VSDEIEKGDDEDEKKKVCRNRNVGQPGLGRRHLESQDMIDKNQITEDALDAVKENADGSQYVRVYLHYGDGKYEVRPHFFSNHQWDDIDQSGQHQLCAFEQFDLLSVTDCGEGEGVHNECECEPESYFDTGFGEDFLNNIKTEIETSLATFSEDEESTTTTSIRKLEEIGALSSNGSGYTHKEVLFAAAALAYKNNPAITNDELYSLLYDESDMAMAVTLNEINADAQDWQEFCADAENYSTCF